VEYLTEEFIRAAIVDKDVADNLVRMKVTFSSKDIQTAFEMAALAYNAIPPLNHHVKPDTLPKTDVHLLGVMRSLYRMALAHLRRNDFKVEAGNSQVTFTAVQIANFEKSAAEVNDEFQRSARFHKTQLQYDAAFGTIL
jgi:prophage maintenance system killer protein